MEPRTCSKLSVRIMANETKIKEWTTAVLKILQEGSDDKAIQNFVKFVNGKADTIMG